MKRVSLFALATSRNLCYLMIQARRVMRVAYTTMYNDII